MLPRRVYSAPMFVLLALLSSVVWGIADFIGGFTSKRMHVVAVVGLSQVFGLAAVLVWGAASGAVWDSSVWPWALVATIGGDIGLMAFYQALAIGRMGIVAPIAGLSAVVPLLVGLAQGDRPSLVQSAAMVVGVVGVVLASGPEFSGKSSPRSVALAVVAAIGFGVALTGLARGAEVSLFATTAIMRTVTIAAVLLALPFMPSVRRPGSAKWWQLAVSGSFDVLANITFGLASQQGMLALVSVLGSLYPVVTAFLAFWILHERLLKVQYVGAALTLLGVIGIVAG